MPSFCKARTALVRGIRPQLSTQRQVATTQSILQSCCLSSDCIYCDIWKLAALIASHVPLASRYNLATGTPTSSPVSSAPSSPIFAPATPYSSMISKSKKIETAFQTQRARLSSILSICTVDGADQVQGLRIAHDRCSEAIEDLLDQEELLEELILKDIYANDQQYPCHPGNDHRRLSWVDAI